MRRLSICCVVFFCFNVSSQIINFPDANFKAKLLQSSSSYDIATDNQGNFVSIDSNNDNEIDIDEAEAIVGLNIVFGSINSVEGIQHFTNLVSFNCSNNNITSLPISSLQNIVWLSCGQNNLMSLTEIENMQSIEYLNISYNPLTSFDFHNLINLRRIDAIGTTLNEINLCGTQVSWLWCYDSPNLHSLYLKNNIISSDIAAKYLPTIPPPLHNFEFNNSPLLNYLCYDEGELPAVTHGVGYNTQDKVLTTDCSVDCASLSNTLVQKKSFVIYPNPVENILTIKSNEENEFLSIIIMNAIGQKLFSVDNQSSIDVSSLTRGTYFITIETDKGKQTQKFIKQ